MLDNGVGLIKVLSASRIFYEHQVGAITYAKI